MCCVIPANDRTCKSTSNKDDLVIQPDLYSMWYLVYIESACFCNLILQNYTMTSLQLGLQMPDTCLLSNETLPPTLPLGHLVRPLQTSQPLSFQPRPKQKSKKNSGRSERVLQQPLCVLMSKVHNIHYSVGDHHFMCHLFRFSPLPLPQTTCAMGSSTNTCKTCMPLWWCDMWT